MGILNDKCVDNHQPVEDLPMTTFRRAMKTYRQVTLINNEKRFSEDDKISLLKELERTNYALLDYVSRPSFTLSASSGS